MNSRGRRKKSFKRILKHKIFRKRNIFSIFSFVLGIVLIILMLLTNIFPIKYYLLITDFVFFFNILGILLINVHKKVILKIMGVIILGFSFISNIVALYYINTTNEFINKSFVSNNKYNKNTYYVITKKSNNLKESDISGAVATYKETANLSEALEKLSDKHSVLEEQFIDLGAMFDSLNNDSTKFMLIDKASFEIVFLIDSNLRREDYQIIYDLDIFTKKKISDGTNSKKFNIFIGLENFAGLMDFNMIASINMDTYQVLLTLIPKNYYIEVPEKGGRRDKLGIMNIYGADTNKKAIEKLFDIKIDYNLILNTKNLVNIVDYVGGVSFCCDNDFTTTYTLGKDEFVNREDKLHIVEGCQQIDGIDVVNVVRDNENFFKEDSNNLEKIVVAIFKKLISTDSIIHYSETLNTLESLYETDISKEIVTSFLKNILNNSDKWQITTQIVSGEEELQKVHLSNMTDLVINPTYDTIDQASTKIKGLLNK